MHVSFAQCFDLMGRIHEVKFNVRAKQQFAGTGSQKIVGAKACDYIKIPLCGGQGWHLRIIAPEL